MALNKQMEMFEDGGLKDEGGMIDEVSGNDVPSGSTREEVRDDIPAQLSEGEFVFPADVVRFIGLEKLMQLRQEAKQGLKQMEAMGQMGNSDEATMRDDMPFDINDLDMEDEVEYNRGGVVEAANGTFVQNAMPITYNPLNTTQTNTVTGNPTQIQAPMDTSNPYTGNPQTAYKTGIQPYAPVDYTTALGTSAVGAPQTESVRYFNAATGQSRTIPHIINADGSRGATLFPVPKGFVIQEEAPKEEAKKTTKVQSAKVAPVESGDSDGNTGGGGAVDPSGDPLSYKSIFSNTDPSKPRQNVANRYSNLDKTLKSLGSMQLGMLTKVTGAPGVISTIAGAIKGTSSPNDIKVGAMVEAFRTAKVELGVAGQNVANLSGYDRDALNRAMTGAVVAVNQISKNSEGEALDTKEIADRVNALAEKYGVKDRVSTKTNVNRQVSIGKVIAQIEKAKEIEVQKEMNTAANIAERRKFEERSAEGPTGGTADVAAQASYEKSMQDSGGGDYSGYDTGDGGAPDAYDDPNMNQGGLAGKKKTPKPKKMKRGGLASR